MEGATCGILTCYSVIAVLVAVAALDYRRKRIFQEEVDRRGVELEAEVLGRFEAGALEGSGLAKARQSQMASWDPLELELRYVFKGQEIVSRSRVPVETFFRTRGMKTLKIKVLPHRPEQWVVFV